MLSDWYTDLLDVYRIEKTVDYNVNVEARVKVNGSPIPCRVYSSEVTGANPQSTAAVTRQTDKLACAVNTDILPNDELIVTRGGRVGGTRKERYIAGRPQLFYDPVGFASTGIAHMEIGLYADNIVEA